MSSLLMARQILDFKFRFPVQEFPRNFCCALRF
jgi:hypothetical protein